MIPCPSICDKALVLALVVITSSGCALPLRRTCLDGWPIKILQDPQCPRGICGYTCAPDRWRSPETDAATPRPHPASTRHKA